MATASVPALARVHLPGIDGFRFLAALAVLFSHVEMFKHAEGLPSIWELRPLGALGGAPVHLLGGRGVSFFFVLSGFLITYLLLVERDRTGRIDLGRFYLRRVLRIWPLYLLVGALGLLLLPRLLLFHSPLFATAFDPSHPRRLLFTALFSAQFLVVYRIELGATFAGVLWSVGVEEHFYAAWPLLMRRARGLPWLMLGIVLALPLARFAVGLALASGDGLLPLWRLKLLDRFLFVSRFDCMALGALGAWLHWRGRLPGVLLRPATQLVALLGLGAGLVLGIELPLVDETLYGAGFLVLILNASLNPRPIADTRGPVLDYLGQISYGLYCYHSIVIVAVLNLLPGLFRIHPWLGEPALYALCVAGTIAVSALSYRLYEKPFLDLKDRFAVVASGRGSGTRP
jgi:peptidoglycan/LPS O-acetylase OafA/YrhL